jgi:hypothetical protein
VRPHWTGSLLAEGSNLAPLGRIPNHDERASAEHRPSQSSSAIGRQPATRRAPRRNGPTTCRGQPEVQVKRDEQTLCRFAWLPQAANWKEKWADSRDASPMWGRRTTQTLIAYRSSYGRCKQANRLGGSERGERRTRAMARSVIGTALALRCWWPAPARRCASAGRGAGHGNGRPLNLQLLLRSIVRAFFSSRTAAVARTNWRGLETNSHQSGASLWIGRCGWKAMTYSGLD